MYTMLTGKNPAEPPYQILPLRQVDASLSPALERVIAKATQPDPVDRYQDCAEFAYALSHYREEDAGQRAELERVWKRFVGLVAASVVSLAVGVGGLIGYNIALNSDFGYWMQIARQTSSEEEARSAYVKAVEIMPGSTEPYEGLAGVYRSDQVFTIGEEQQLRAVILPNLGELRADEDYARMAFDIGKLYWYNYAASDAATKGTRSERIRAAAQWMNDAAADEDFEQHELAQAYAGIAEFETIIVPLIKRGPTQGSIGRISTRFRIYWTSFPSRRTTSCVWRPPIWRSMRYLLILANSARTTFPKRSCWSLSIKLRRLWKTCIPQPMRSMSRKAGRLV